MPLQATSGAASYDAFGGGVPVVPNYIEDVFSTWLVTAPQRVVNGLDFSGKGGLVWGKQRNGGGSYTLVDTARGGSNFLQSNSTSQQLNEPTIIPTFYNDGFETGSYVGSGNSFVYWGFREAPKFFDVVTYTGNGTGQNISHNLGSVPGCIIVKRVTSDGNWQVYHRSTGNNRSLYLNDTLTGITGAGIWNNTDPTSTAFTVGSFSEVNQSGATYVAYLFAHNAGGFGLTGTDNVISCGSYTGNDNNNGPEINLGWEPQWVMIKNATTAGNSWRMFDNMRGMDVNTTGSGDGLLSANTSSAEAYTNRLSPTATGFKITDTAGDVNSPSGNTFIYIAIRRGPMRTPTTGTSVYNAVTYSGDSGASRTITGAGFPPDLSITKTTSRGNRPLWFDRLRGRHRLIHSNDTAAEFNDTSTLSSFNMDGISIGNTGETTYDMNYAGTNYVDWFFRRAPGFMDEVCYTGDSTNPRSISHNLTVAPTLIITKKRNSTSNWITGFDFASTTYKYFFLNDSGAANPDTYANTPVYGGNPTASVFIVGNQGSMNISGDTYVSYLFASAPGVSKVGSYTGTGTTQTINCGFTGGARFVLIKRTDSTGDWYVWDSARGIVAGNDPYLLLNSTAAEVTNTDFVDTAATGFEISSTAPAAINASGGTFLFLAIA